MKPAPTVVRAPDLAAYAPANHTGTLPTGLGGVVIERSPFGRDSMTASGLGVSCQRERRQRGVHEVLCNPDRMATGR